MSHAVELPSGVVTFLLSDVVGSEILLSRAAADLVVDHLDADAELVELGRAELRDLDRHETVYVLRQRSAAVGAQGSGSDGQGARLAGRDALPPQPDGNLPKRTTSFVGRGGRPVPSVRIWRRAASRPSPRSAGGSTACRSLSRLPRREPLR